MYRAKALGKGRCEVFDADMRALITDRLQIENDLRRAVDRDELCNLYQPIISLESDHIVGFEALMRWHHPTRGLLQPDEFIPVAEETGMIRELGWWALSEACQQIAAWRKLHPSFAESDHERQPVSEAVPAAEPGREARSAPRRTQSSTGYAEAGTDGKLHHERFDRDDGAAGAASSHSACASRSTTSGPATPRSATCSDSLSTR